MRDQKSNESLKNVGFLCLNLLHFIYLNFDLIEFKFWKSLKYSFDEIFIHFEEKFLRM